MDEKKEVINEKIKEVSGGKGEELDGGYFRCSNQKCWRHNTKFDVGVDECPDCGWPFEYVNR